MISKTISIIHDNISLEDESYELSSNNLLGSSF